MATILESYFAVNVIYPFLLSFTLIFAILQKSKILGDDKKQIDALVAFSISIIFVTFSWATGIVSAMMPFLAVSLVILLVFMILYGFVASTNTNGLVMGAGLKKGLGVLAALAVIVAVIVATGQWDKVVGSLFSSGGQTTGLASNILLIAIIIGALAVVWRAPGSDKGKGSKSSGGSTE
ncbi:MAG: hypothetical protein WC796_01630 [Candidatus Pacearchaeota archaeon]|jgi:predicted neutral ceramidase superfamily lipid hydrolase